MTVFEKTKSNKKNVRDNGYRMTPADKHRWSLDVSERIPRRNRSATSSEVRANNMASVRTAEDLADVSSWIGVIEHELSAMNSYHVGAPFRYCDTMIVWILMTMSYLNISFRKAAGLSAGVMRAHGFETPSYNTIHDRASKLLNRYVSDVLSNDGHIIHMYVATPNVRRRRVAIDSTGLNLTATSLWRKIKWSTGPKERGWLKLHALADVDSGEILAYVLTDNSVGDVGMLAPLLEATLSAGHEMDVLYADGAYSSVENFKFVCKDKKMRFVTSFRCNTLPRNNGSIHRGDAARLWCSLPYDEWVEVTGYGKRWKIESVFSDLKRVISELLNARSVAGMSREVLFKIRAFNEHKSVRANIMRITGNGVIIGAY